LVLDWKEFNGTPQFCSLPQGERKEYPPHPNPLPLVEKELVKVKLGIGGF